MTSILFMGRKKVSVRCLEYLLQRPDVRVAGVLTDSHLAVSVTADLARSHGLPLYTYETATAAVSEGELNFDLGLSMLFWRKFKDGLLAHPSHGIVNFHPAPLPQYKGVGGYNLAVLNGLTEWACTAHYVDASIDTGPIIADQVFPIDPETATAQSLERTSQDVLFSLFTSVVDQICTTKGKVETRPNGPGLYLSRPELEALKKVDLATDDIDRKVRAFWFPPYDGAYVEVDGKRFTLVNRTLLEALADPDSSSLFSQPAGKDSVGSRPERIDIHRIQSSGRSA